MKILLITVDYLPNIGGIALYVKHLADKLVEKGADVSVFVGDATCKKAAKTKEENLFVVRVPAFSAKGMTWLKGKEAKKTLFEALGDADIVHLNDTKFLYKFLAKQKRRFGYKLFFSSHGFIFHTKSFWTLKRLFMKKISKYSAFYDINYCVSDNDMKVAKEFNFANTKKLIPGTDTKKFADVDANVFEKGNFVCFGRIAPNKGTLELIKAFKKSCEKDWRLLIIGKSCDDKKYQAEVENAALEDGRISLVGFKSDEEIKQYAQKAEFFVFPSLYEGFGMALVEALSSGKRIIARDIQTFKEILVSTGMEESIFDFENGDIEKKVEELRHLPIKRPDLQKYSVEFMAEVIFADYVKFRSNQN